MNAVVDQTAVERARILRGYSILDTPREHAFDAVVGLAARLCDAPVAIINLIDDTRQWFKAEIGLECRTMPLESSICFHALKAGDYMEVPDTLLDARTRDYPQCTAVPGMRFYAGAVLIAGDVSIGTLCVLDTVPRTLDATQRHALLVLAAQVMAQLDLRATLRREALLRKEIDHRVKNSLHSVAAFARLQQRAVTTDEARASLEAVEQQIGTVAMLHDLLAGTDEQASVDLAAYLGRLATLLAATVPRLTVERSFAPLTIDARVAGTIGVIVNELFANAVKHSFGEGGTGRIALSGARLDAATFRLTCVDDGPGTPPGADDGRARLGLRIIAASVAQLGGTLTSERTAGGYASTLDFPAGTG